MCCPQVVRYQTLICPANTQENGYISKQYPEWLMADTDEVISSSINKTDI